MKISPSELEFQPGREIPTPRVRFPYPIWTLMMDCYIPEAAVRSGSTLFAIPAASFKHISVELQWL